MTARIATGAWLAYGAAAGLMALFALAKWGQAVALAAPVLYGEGAVAHAAILARTFATYGDAGGASFTAANYPPLYFLIASVGDPFVTGRQAHGDRARPRLARPRAGDGLGCGGEA